MSRRDAGQLERFAIQIEDRLRKSGSTNTIQNLICRILTDKKRPDLAARMAEKWVEWRYGKKERHAHTGVDSGTIVHTIRFGDGKRDET